MNPSAEKFVTTLCVSTYIVRYIFYLLFEQPECQRRNFSNLYIKLWGIYLDNSLEILVDWKLVPRLLPNLEKIGISKRSKVDI